MLSEKILLNYPECIFESDISDEWRWERIRIHRDNLLKESDFRMIEDAPWDKTTWASYRQALRDLPESVTNPAEIIFPNLPA